MAHSTCEHPVEAPGYQEPEADAHTAPAAGGGRAEFRVQLVLYCFIQSRNPAPGMLPTLRLGLPTSDNLK